MSLFNTINIPQVGLQRTINAGNVGYTATIDVVDSQENILAQRVLQSKEEVDSFINKYGKPVKRTGFCNFTFLIPRPDNAKEFFQYLLLPNFFITARKSDSIAQKIFNGIINVIFDLITLAPRLLIAPFKLFYDLVILRCDKVALKNSVQAPPVAKLLKNTVQAKDVLKSGYVWIKLNSSNAKIWQAKPNDEFGATRYASEKLVTRKFVVYTHHLAQPVDIEKSKSKQIKNYLEVQGKWIELPGSTTTINL